MQSYGACGHRAGPELDAEGTWQVRRTLLRDLRRSSRLASRCRCRCRSGYMIVWVVSAACGPRIALRLEGGALSE